MASAWRCSGIAGAGGRAAGRGGGRGLPRRLWPVLLCKLLLFPLALLAGVALLGLSPLALPPLAQAALVLQAAAPTAVSVLLLAEASPTEDPEAVEASAAAAWCCGARCWACSACRSGRGCWPSPASTPARPGLEWRPVSRARRRASAWTFW
ncbi:hypothetical protein [Synechococcus sp. GFB01]|uniref:hypothetical protein n=1 Tax=Synechococcus sp. GFB01 TaxID=1662190 RepID=UPI001F2417C1|nr:hypothetical protein [Synechococcus sp. GFB01]